MRTPKQLNTETMHRMEPEFLQGPWVVVVDEDGFRVRCRDMMLHTVNGRRPRLYKSMDSVLRSLREELGLKEFKVEIKE